MMGKQALDTAEHPTGAGLEGLGENLALMAGGGFGELGGRGILRLADILRRPPPDPTVSDTPSPIVPGGSPQGAESDMLPEDPLPVLAGVELPGADTHEFALPQFPRNEPTASSEGQKGPEDPSGSSGNTQDAAGDAPVRQGPPRKPPDAGAGRPTEPTEPGPHRRVKIVNTIGPASSTVDVLRKMMDAGTDVIRINGSHLVNLADPESALAGMIDATRKGADEAKKLVPVLLDLPGVKIRIGEFNPQGKGVRLPAELDPATGQPKSGEPLVTLRKGQSFALRMAGDERGRPTGDVDGVSVTYPGLAADVDLGHTIKLSDGQIELRVTGFTHNAEGERTTIQTTVETGGDLKPRKGINTPDKALSIDAFTADDRRLTEMGLDHGVDVIALSFAQRPEDMRALDDHIADYIRRNPSVRAPLKMAKIETRGALEPATLDAIVREADLVMVARGDLSAEVGKENLPDAQRRIIEAANRLGKPVTVATEVVESMIKHPEPTEAEATDPFASALAGADAVMTSAETAVGAFPLETVAFLRRALEAAAQPAAETARSLREKVGLSAEHASARTRAAVAYGATWEADQLPARFIVVATESGRTARDVSGLLPDARIVALTPDETVARQMQLFGGVEPVLVDRFASQEELLDRVNDVLPDLGAKPGERVVVTSGFPAGEGNSNNVNIYVMPGAAESVVPDAGVSGLSPATEPSVDPVKPEPQPRNTRIGATLGSASNNNVIVKRMIEAGADVLNIDASKLSADPEAADKDLGDTVARIRNAANRTDKIVGIMMDIPVTDADQHLVELAVKHGVDAVAVPVTRAQDVDHVRAGIAKYAGEHGVTHPPLLMAKLGTAETLDNAAEIINAADAVMFERGRLSAELGKENVPPQLARIIALANAAGKPVAVAGGTLRSMTENPVPTNAEVTDLDNSVRAGVDLVMTYLPTAAGENPDHTVAHLDSALRVFEGAEDFPRTALRETAAAGPAARDEARRESDEPQTLGSALSAGAVETAERLGARRIIVATLSGSTARRVSQLFPSQRIIALVTDENVARQLKFSRGIEPTIGEPFETKYALIEQVNALMWHLGAKPGEIVPVMFGLTPGEGHTDTVYYHTMPGQSEPLSEPDAGLLLQNVSPQPVNVDGESIAGNELSAKLRDKEVTYRKVEREGNSTTIVYNVDGKEGRLQFTDPIGEVASGDNIPMTPLGRFAQSLEKRGSKGVRKTFALETDDGFGNVAYTIKILTKSQAKVPLVIRDGPKAEELFGPLSADERKTATGHARRLHWPSAVVESQRARGSTLLGVAPLTVLGGLHFAATGPAERVAGATAVVAAAAVGLRRWRNSRASAEPEPEPEPAPSPSRAPKIGRALGKGDGISTLHPYGETQSIRVYSNDVAAAANVRDRDLGNLAELRKRGIRAVDAKAGPNVRIDADSAPEGQPTIVYDRLYTDLAKALNVKTRRIAMPGSVNERTIADLNDIEQSLRKRGIAVDPHLVIDEGGRVFLSTPAFADTRETDVFADLRREQSQRLEQFIDVAKSGRSAEHLPFRYSRDGELVSGHYPNMGDLRPKEIDGELAMVLGAGADERRVDLADELGEKVGAGRIKTAYHLGRGVIAFFDHGGALLDIANELQEDEIGSLRILSHEFGQETTNAQVGPRHDGRLSIFYPEFFQEGSRQIVRHGAILRPDLLTQATIDSLTRVRNVFVSHGLATGGLEFVLRRDGTAVISDTHGVYKMDSGQVFFKRTLEDKWRPVKPSELVRYDPLDNLRTIDELIGAARSVVAEREKSAVTPIDDSTGESTTLRGLAPSVLGLHFAAKGLAGIAAIAGAAAAAAGLRRWRNDNAVSIEPQPNGSFANDLELERSRRQTAAGHRQPSRPFAEDLALERARRQSDAGADEPRISGGTAQVNRSPQQNRTFAEDLEWERARQRKADAAEPAPTQERESFQRLRRFDQDLELERTKRTAIRRYDAHAGRIAEPAEEAAELHEPEPESPSKHPGTRGRIKNIAAVTAAAAGIARWAAALHSSSAADIQLLSARLFEARGLHGIARWAAERPRAQALYRAVVPDPWTRSALSATKATAINSVLALTYGGNAAATTAYFMTDKFAATALPLKAYLPLFLAPNAVNAVRFLRSALGRPGESPRTAAILGRGVNLLYPAGGAALGFASYKLGNAEGVAAMAGYTGGWLAQHANAWKPDIGARVLGKVNLSTRARTTYDPSNEADVREANKVFARRAALVTSASLAAFFLPKVLAVSGGIFGTTPKPVTPAHKHAPKVPPLQGIPKLSPHPPPGTKLRSSPQMHQVVVTAHDGLHVRKSPSLKAPILGELSYGALVQATGRSRYDKSAGRQFEVVIGRDSAGLPIHGWVAAQYVHRHSGGAVSPTGRFDPKLKKHGYPAVTVEPGESLSSIAASHNVSLAEVEYLNRNHIYDLNIIYPGDTVYLPKDHVKRSA
jgi:pyruvate kinase